MTLEPTAEAEVYGTDHRIRGAELNHAHLSYLHDLARQSRQQSGLPLDPAPSRSSSFPLRLSRPPTASEFREAIARHVPVVVSGCLSDRPRLWDQWQRTGYLVEALRGKEVVVAYTPDGRADDLVPLPGTDRNGKERAGDGGTRTGKVVFALPYDCAVSFGMLVRQLEDQQRCGPASRRQDKGGGSTVAYLQSQNSNLDTVGPFSGDLAPLFRDLGCRDAERGGGAAGEGGGPRPDLEWATEAMDGALPEATNIWVGTKESRTSMHRDHYENLFTVVRGWKEFTLFPPNEGVFLCDDEEFEVYRWKPSPRSEATVSSETFRLQPDPTVPKTRWIPIDPTLPKTSERNQRYVHTAQGEGHDHDDGSDSLPTVPEGSRRYGYALPPLKIRVEKGETLYLPSGWYHHVTQHEDAPPSSSLQADEGQGDSTPLCLCLNWWYAMTDEMALRLERMDSGLVGLDGRLLYRAQ